MVGEITVIPQIGGAGREIIRKAVDEIDASGLRYRVGTAGTSVEGDLDTIFAAVRGIEGRFRTDGVDRAMIEVRLAVEPHAETLEHQIEGIGAES
jgi:uncharacterized protein YqgV (UPF0045/DUF77 family)